MTGAPRCLAAALCCALSLAPLHASADSAAAEALFEEGVQLVARGELGAACQKFEASESLDVAVGTLLRLADCYERIGHLASAWSRFREAASLAQAQAMPDRQRIANVRAEALSPRLAKLQISVKARRPEGFQLQLNGAPVPAASFDVPIPVDSGPIVVVATAPGYLTFRREVDVPTTDGARVAVTVPALEPDLGIDGAVPSPPASSATTDTSAEHSQNVRVQDQYASPQARVVLRDNTAARSERGHTARVVGVTLGVLGGAGLATSGVLAVLAQRRNSASFDYCSDDRRLCSARGVELRREAGRLADAATVSVAAGGGLLLSGLIVYLAAPRQHADSASLVLAPELALGSVGFQARGAF